MLLYVIVAILPLIIAQKYNSLATSVRTEQKRNKYLLWSMMPIFMMIAFRGYAMGSDTGTYLDDFYRFANLSFKDAFEDTRMESGYVIFVKLVAYVTDSAKVFQVIYSSIYYFCFYQFLKKLDNDIPFHVLFFFVTLGEFLFFFTGVRQCLAISLCLLSFRFVIEKKLIYFVLMLALIFNIHHSAALFAVVYPMANMKVTKYNMALYLILLYFASTYLFKAQEFLNNQLNYNYEIEETDSGFIFLALISSMSYIAYKYIYKGRSTEELLSIIFNINIITLFFWVLRLQTRIAERPSFYFLPFSCVMFAYMTRKVTDKTVLIMVYIVPFAYYIYRFFGTYKLFANYTTFFFE